MPDLILGCGTSPPGSLDALWETLYSVGAYFLWLLAVSADYARHGDTQGH